MPRTSTSAAVLAAGACATVGTLNAFVSHGGQVAKYSQPEQQQSQNLRKQQSQTYANSEDTGAPVGLMAAVGAVAGWIGVSKRKSSKQKARKTQVVRQAIAASDADIDCVNAVRFLALDAVNKANSGHPGAPMGQAPIGYVLYGEEMNYNPEDPDWVNRDRFVLSSGHGCMLQYSLLHLSGFANISMDDLKQFRQWGSKTPGHPENFETAGVEATTGPLGTGISNAVGLAAAEAHLAAVYNKPGLPLVDHYTYCILGDGCMQEGVSHESCAYAGHLGLGKLIAFYDDNGITIDGETTLSFTEDVGKRFEAYGWQVLTVEDGNNDVNAIRRAVASAKACKDKPTLIKVKTVIGYGSPNKANTHTAHGAPLGSEEAVATRENLGWKYGEFEIPQSVYDVFRKHAADGKQKQEKWQALWAEYCKKEPELAKQFQRVVIDKKLPDGWEKSLPTATPEDKGKATRLWSHDCLNAIASTMPDLIGGSADLAPSNMTLMKCSGDFLKGSYEGRNMRFGIREFGMGAVANGISYHNTGLIPYCATFTIFTDYMRNAIRLSALAQCGTIFVTTHDSIAVGEDGPTHQPIETIPSLRMIPDLTVFRPADCNETSAAYKIAVEKSKYESMPTLLAFTRQSLPNLPNSTIENASKGAYAVVECANPELILLGTGSEVHLCVEAAKELKDKKIRVVSMPSWEIFRSQPESYRNALLPAGVPTLSVEAGVTMGWQEFADAHVGINVFGASGPGGTCLDKFGFNVPNIVSCALARLAGQKGILSDGSHAKH